ncbi:MAG: metallophosphoesterase, partial [Victivallales bacterium]|nr:metallophosphoesterase [Victivallales bacterium]
METGQTTFQAFPYGLRHRPFAVPQGKNGIRMTFMTNASCGGGVRYGIGGKWQKAYDTLGGRIRTDRRIHHVLLEALEPGVAYETQPFAVVPATGEEVPLQAPQQLRLPENDFSLFAIADLHRTIPERRELLNAYIENCRLKSCDLLVSLGDFTNAADDLEAEYFQGGLDEILEAGGKIRQMAILRGNHEMRGRQADMFFSIFAPGKAAYFGFNYGKAAFVVLDSGECEPPGPNDSACPNIAAKEYFSRQRKWLQDHVQTEDFRQARFKVVLSHGIPVPTEKHTYMPGNLLELTDGIFTGDSPHAEISLWLAGHIHSFAHIKANSLPGIPFPILCTEGPDSSRRQDSAFLL